MPAACYLPRDGTGRTWDRSRIKHWRNWLRWLAVACGALMALVALGGFFLPRHARGRTLRMALCGECRFIICNGPMAGKEQLVSSSNQIHPEISQSCGVLPCYTAHQCRGNRDARGGGREVVNGQSDHLGEIGSGGFSAVVYPARI